MSLYHYICKYFKFPVGHPFVHVGDTYKEMEACFRMDSLIKCRIVPPQRLYHPVLPYSYNKNICFACVGRACTFHIDDEERALTGTWVLDEVRLAI
jgi:hypothetical protein